MTNQSLQNLQGKKLLILGGNPETRLLVDVARQLKIVTWVVDPDPHSAAKQSADHALEIDGLDVNQIVAKVRENQIDGVLVGVADSLVPSYEEICRKLELPCYASQRIIEAFSSKDGFAQTCKSNDICTTPSYTEDEAQHRRIPLSNFPLIVKPVDRGSGIGMSICHNYNELAIGIGLARSTSIRKRVLIEKLMRCDDLFAYYTFVDGVAYLSALGDRFTTRKQNTGSPVCIGATYPSQFLEKFKHEVNPRLIQMFNHLRIQNGVLNIQFFHENGHFYAYDPGFRLQGEAPHLHLKAANGFDHRAMLIHFALTGAMMESDFSKLNDPHLQGRFGATVWILLREGTIHHIRGIEEITALESYQTHMQRFEEGSTIMAAMLGTERQVFVRIYLQHTDRQKLNKDIQTIHQELAVVDINGENLILDGLNRND